MKLILHIGTHKTGTTALQQFLHSNRGALTDLGIHYATPRHGLQDANVVANALNVGHIRSVRKFLSAHTRLAGQRNAHSIVVSSENFYAMSVLDAMQRRQVFRDAPEADRALIETLKTLVPENIMAIQIICYFRRPDRYAESLYSQHVKRGIIFDGTFQEFLPIIEPALRYRKHMQAWSEAFGRDNCTVRQYESVGGDIVTDFLRNVMDIVDVEQFIQPQSHANERLSRDALEFKRLRNKAARPNERDIERTILRVVDEELALRTDEPSCYHDFLSPDERADFLSRLKPEMDALQASYGMGPFPHFDPGSARESWTPYPGLAEQRGWELESHYGRVSSRVAFRIDRLTLRSAGFFGRTCRAPVRCSTFSRR